MDIRYAGKRFFGVIIYFTLFICRKFCRLLTLKCLTTKTINIIVHQSNSIAYIFHKNQSIRKIFFQLKRQNIKEQTNVCKLY